MQQTNLKPGDTVRLKSGGALMTIERIHSNSGLAALRWFDARGVHHSVLVRAIALEPAEPEKSAG